MLTQQETFQFTVCSGLYDKVCALREGCYKAGAKYKTYSVTIKTATQQAQLAFQQTEEFKEAYRERYKIEAKNAELKNVVIRNFVPPKFRKVKQPENGKVKQPRNFIDLEI